MKIENAPAADTRRGRLIDSVETHALVRLRYGGRATVKLQLITPCGLITEVVPNSEPARSTSTAIDGRDLAPYPWASPGSLRS